MKNNVQAIKREIEMSQASMSDSPQLVSAFGLDIRTNNTPTTAHVKNSASDDYVVQKNTPSTPGDSKRFEIIQIRNEIQQNYIKNKWRKLAKNPHCYCRICSLCVLFLLLLLCISYCIGQMLEVHLQLIIECNEENMTSVPFTDNGDATHCVNSKNSFEVDPTALWLRDEYEYEWKDDPVNGATIVFALISIYCILRICICIISTVHDIICIQRNTLHTKSKLYIKSQSVKKDKSKKKESVAFIQKLKHWYSEATGWIVVMCISEFVEIILQSQALLLYNGYNIFDPYHEHDVYLANDPNVIIMFVTVLSSNCCVVGLCWFIYAICNNNKCHKGTFKWVILTVDQLFDVFYATVPIYIVTTNDYIDFYIFGADAESLLNILANFNTETNIQLLSALMPLFLLLNKFIAATVYSIHKIRDQHYNEWSFVQSIANKTDIELIKYEAKLRNFKKQPSLLQGLHSKEMYDSNGNIQLNLQRMNSQQAAQPIGIFPSRLLLCVALIFVIFGVSLFIITMQYIHKSISYCEDIERYKHFTNEEWEELYEDINKTQSEETYVFETNPEMFVFQMFCLFKVYPFVSEDRYRCQCRAFIMDWNLLFSTGDKEDEEESEDSPDYTYVQFIEANYRIMNLSQSKILDSIMRNWFMLEKFSTSGAENVSSDITSTTSNILRSDMYHAVKMKAFSWKGSQLTAIEKSISKWKDLQYFHIENTRFVSSLPSDFDGLESLRYFGTLNSGLQEFPEQLCNLDNLNIIQIEDEVIQTVPECITELLDLNRISLNHCANVSSVPLSIFYDVSEVLLWKTGLSFSSFVNESQDVNDWNDDAYFQIAETPLCAEMNATNEFQNFLSACVIPTCYFVCNQHDYYDYVNA